jgi:hypothetical protein
VTQLCTFPAFTKPNASSLPVALISTSTIPSLLLISQLPVPFALYKLTNMHHSLELRHSQHLENLSLWNQHAEHSTNFSLAFLQPPSYTPARPSFGFKSHTKGPSLFSLVSLFSIHWLIAFLAMSLVLYILSIFSYERSLQHIPKVGYGKSFWGRIGAGFRVLVHPDRVITEGYKLVCGPTLF